MENVSEVWKDIKGYPGYQISNMGRVWSIKSNRYLKPFLNNSGYRMINVQAINGKRKGELIHRLVALHFIDNPNKYPEVNHIDRDRQNNCVSNLEWVDRKTNMAKSSLPQRIRVFDKQENIVGEYNSIREACQALRLTESNVSCCLSSSGAQKTHRGYHFKKY